MRIAIVNDLPIAVEAMRRALIKAPQHKVVWVARDGAEAVQRCRADRPDLILMDLVMPILDGIEATRQIMSSTPCGILIVTATVSTNSAKVYEALGAGAIDVVKTPILDAPSQPNGAEAFLSKIETIGKLIAEPLKPTGGRQRSSPLLHQARTARLIAIGSSAGGPVALAEILRVLPASLPAAIIIVQHVDEQFAQGFAEWLGTQSKLPVRLAGNNDHPEPGVVLVAGRSDHLVFLNSNTLAYTPDPADYAYRPSVDVFFQSIVDHWPGEVTGVLLTGMGRDGALGLKALRQAKHHTIAQDRGSSAVYGMPKAAAQLEAAVEILPLSKIGPALERRVLGNAKSSR
jgi:two-component system response regulator WspF